MFILLLGTVIFFFRCGSPFPEEDPVDDRYLTRHGFHGLRIARDIPINMEDTSIRLLSLKEPQSMACGLVAKGDI
jgi:hypothetical protein